MINSAISLLDTHAEIPVDFESRDDPVLVTSEHWPRPGSALEKLQVLIISDSNARQIKKNNKFVFKFRCLRKFISYNLDNCGKDSHVSVHTKLVFHLNKK